MSKLKISLDNQIFMSNRNQNVGIYKHYLILRKQLLELDLNLTISETKFVHHSKTLKKMYYPLGVLASLLKKFKPGVFWSLARAESARKSKKSDFIFTTFFYSSWFDTYSGTNSLSKMIVCNHDCINENLIKSKYQISIIGQSKREFLLASKAVYVPSSWSFDKTIEYYPSVKQKLFLIPHFIEYSQDSIHEEVVRRFQRSTEEKGNKKLRLLHIGSTETYKNFDLIYDMLLNSKTGVQLILLGCDSSDTLMAKIRHLKSLGHEVIIDAFASEEMKTQCYRNADALLIPSLDEGFSFPTYEAAAVGLPIVKYSKNPWGFSGLTITTNFSVNAIIRALKIHYKNKDASQVVKIIVNELDLNNESSTNGLRLLIEYLSESK
jgi:glycosyltransferase involved in cell wall biosynthesis